MHGARLQRAEARGAQQQRHDVRRHNVRRGAQPPPALEGQPGGGQAARAPSNLQSRKRISGASEDADAARAACKAAATAAQTHTLASGKDGTTVFQHQPQAEAGGGKKSGAAGGKSEGDTRGGKRPRQESRAQAASGMVPLPDTPGLENAARAAPSAALATLESVRLPGGGQASGPEGLQALEVPNGLQHAHLLTPGALTPGLGATTPGINPGAWMTATPRTPWAPSPSRPVKGDGDAKADNPEPTTDNK